MLRNSANILIIISSLCFFLCCQEDEETITPPVVKDSIATDSSVAIDLKGYVQKGPFINGTAITLSELNEKLIPTGKNFTTQIADNKGSFSLKEIPIQSKYVQLQADGFYFDEVKGEKSSAQLTLFALADISDASTVNVNLLSHLERNRVIYLMQEEEQEFEQAKQQAQQEILTAFGITQDSLVSSEHLDISQDGDHNAILLAISAILQGNNSVAELSELLANLVTDLREDGQLNSETIPAQLKKQSISLDLPQIRKNLVQRYADLGVEVTIPNFEQYIDSDGDGILNKDEDDTPEEFSFTSQENVATSTELFSNEITLTGLKEEGASDAHATQSTLFINGKAMQDSVVQVRNGDNIKLQITSSSQYADTTVASLSIGTLTRNFTVITDDYLPEAISFMNQKDVAVDSWYTSDTITVRGLPYPTPTTIDNGIIVKNGIELTTDTTSIITGDKLAIKLLSHQEYYSSTSSILSINGIEAPFQLTTDNYTPDEFSFTSIKNAKRDSVYTSEPITISGLPHPTPIDIDRGTLLINGKLSGTNALVISGDQIAVKLTASSDYETALSSSIQIGASYHTISITTGLNPWQKKADIPEGAYYSLVVNDNLIAIAPSLSQVFIYSFTQDTWQTIPSVFPDEFQYFRAEMISFSIGDIAFYGLGSNPDKAYRDFWAYNPKSNTWTRKADFPGNNLAGATAFTIGDKGYIGTGKHINYLTGVPGYDEENINSLTNEFWEYDPTTNQWIQKADFPGERRHNATSFSINEKGYLLAGNLTLHTPEYAPDMYEYNPYTDQWILKAEVPEPQYAGRATSCVINSKAYVSFYYDMHQFQVYDPVGNSWILSEDDLFQDSGFSISSFNNKIYAKSYKNYLNVTELWEYTPPQE
uniref:Kelch repeat-containing protein n=1 Tax=Roseihalotalea indica TaxID=2867963 RepID=A0AA49GL06_9BACT|nr:kelch repeat-containing protein [Tunicatimonas sp. TK19036]